MVSEKFIKFKSPGGDKAVWGIVNGNKCRHIEGTPYSKYDRTGRESSIDEIEIISPVSPTKIICIGLNYTDHAAELGMELPEEPLFFLKAPSAVIGSGRNIIKPPGCDRLDYEAELGLVIKQRCKNVSEELVRDYILGYTCFNDITARDIQEKESQWAHAKSFDTFAPAGPYIVTGINPGKLRIKLSLNGEIKQESNTANMIFSVYELVSYISENMTLYPGDLITAGTPPGVGQMEIGDRVEVEIENTGKLVNYIE
jgi:2-keto-4-pentenoate hydratase/2-oxohepta-3-ene-1,7-dioic acid hydratase in catechol pathway